jgi:hypothetical protein
MNARVDLDAAVQGVHASPAQPCIRYAAATALGRWQLRLEVDGASATTRGAAGAAQALLEADDLLLALDTWCVEAELDTLAWRWAADGVDDGGDDHQDRGANARWRVDASDVDAADADASDAGPRGSIGVSLEAPWPALRRLGAMPSALRASLRWRDAWAVCVLDRFALDDDEAARLEPGGALLLAASLETPWRGALRALDEDEHAGLALDLAAAEGGVALIATPAGAQASTSATAATSVARADAARAPRGSLWEVRSLQPQRVPVPVLCGWARPEAPWSRALFTEIELARCGAVGAPRATSTGPQACMPGRLMPWGRGVAMLLAHG